PGDAHRARQRGTSFMARLPAPFRRGFLLFLPSPRALSSLSWAPPMSRRLVPVVLLLIAVLRSGAAASPTKQTLHLRFPKVSIPTGGSLEACVLIRVPTTTPFDLATWEIRNNGPKVGLGVVHFLVY